MRTIRPGDRGEAVRDVQARLVALGHVLDTTEQVEHRFGPSTEAAVRALQQERGLIVDALVGPITWSELVEAGYALGDRILYLRYPYFRGDDVRALQDRLNVLGFDPGREDGIFGDQTGQAVREFQRNVGLNPDGIVGLTTLQALDRLRRPLPGPARTAVQETEDLREHRTLTGRTIAIDAGHGPEDPGGRGPGGTTEGQAASALAEGLAAALEARGAEPVMLRAPGEAPPAQDRVARANASGAAAVISIHLNSHDDPTAEGSSSYYFGRSGFVSVAGQRLAELIQEELTSRVGLRDGRAHPKSFPLLRGTRMTAVQVEPCFVTNPKEERLLGDDSFRRGVAEALATALERFFAGSLPEDAEAGSDAPEGTGPR